MKKKKHNRGCSDKTRRHRMRKSQQKKGRVKEKRMVVEEVAYFNRIKMVTLDHVPKHHKHGYCQYPCNYLPQVHTHSFSLSLSHCRSA